MGQGCCAACPHQKPASHHRRRAAIEASDDHWTILGPKTAVQDLAREACSKAELCYAEGLALEASAQVVTVA